MTLVFIDIVISFLKSRSEKVQKVLEGVPTIIVENGRSLEERMRNARVSEDDVMEAARRLRGIERLEQIRYAVLEVNGGITVIPYDSPRTPGAHS
jgi:uncharacterized membrane protein YcaP (DUF421 family)